MVGFLGSVVGIVGRLDFLGEVVDFADCLVGIVALGFVRGSTVVALEFHQQLLLDFALKAHQPIKDFVAAAAAGLLADKFQQEHHQNCCWK